MEALESKTTRSNPCIWMQAGVIKKKECNHYFDCTTCKYDKAMGKNAAAGKHISWQEALRCRDSKDRTCRHTLTKRAAHRTCPMNYNCSRCDFDQTFEESLSPGAVHLDGPISEIKGFKLPENHYFHQGHTWARMEAGGFIRVGMDDFALKVLGPPDSLALPLMGQELNQGVPGWGMKRQDKLADVQSPINGIITRVNPDPARSPARLAEDPYAEGWLFTIHHSNPKQALKALMDDTESPKWLDADIRGLEVMIEETAGPMSTDGGLLRPDVYGSMPELGWSALTRRFLGT